MSRSHSRALSSSPASSSDDEAVIVESLVAGREKRSTAGNRLTSLITRETSGEDDELELLFAEEGEDVEFADEDAVPSDDDALESSSDEEDGGDGRAGEDDDMAGERELQRQAKAAKLAKRKAKDAFLQMPKKKVRIEPDSGEQAVRPKKADRVWAPSMADASGATRQSSRTLSVINKELVHARLEEDEKRRKASLAQMEKEGRTRERKEKHTMTQEERLAEAARVEKVNSKSLNRWEEAEKQRQGERAAKLAALHNRHMDGPFLRYWSGPVQWVNGRAGIIGKKAIEKMGDKEKAEGRKSQSPAEVRASQSPVMRKAGIVATIEASDGTEPQPAEQIEVLDDKMDVDSALDVEMSTGDNEPQPEAEFQEDPLAVLPQTSSPSTTTLSSLVREISAKNLIVLENFNPNLVKDREVQKQILFHRPTQKIQRPNKELCVITSRVARYRDPQTGLPYHDKYAFKQLQRLREGKIRWSDLLGAYVGSDEVHARGVPERFYH